MNCSWTLTSNANLKLVFFRFDVEGGFDFVSVYDGGSALETVIGEFNGTSLPKALTSSRNKLFVKFTTDYSVIRKGFAASYHGKTNRQLFVVCRSFAVIFVYSS